MGKILHDPSVFAKKLMKKIARACQKFAEATIEAGVDVLFVGDDYADSRGLNNQPKTV